MDIKNIIARLRQINEALSLQDVQAAEKQAMDAAAAKKKSGGWGGFTTLDPVTAGNDALAALAAKSGLPGLMNSKGEFVVAQGDAEFHSKPNSPRTAPPNRDDTLALQKLGLIPGNAQGPSGLANMLTRGDAEREFQASKTDSARTGATNTSNEFIKRRLGQLKNLVARIRSKGAAAGGATPGAPAQSGKSVMKPPTQAQTQGWDVPGVNIVKESIHSSLSNILKEEFGYDLSEKVTLGTGPVVQQDIGNGITINAGQYQKEVALIRKIMAELADIDDPEVIAALQDAQAALDELAKGSSAGGSGGAGDKEKDRARMKELVALTKKPPVSDTDMEESTQPKSLSESMSAIRNKLLLLEAPLPVPAGAGRNAIATRPNLPAKRPGAADDVIDVDARVIPNKSGMSMGQKVAIGTGAVGAGTAGVTALNGEKPTRDPNGAYRGDRTDVKPTTPARDPNGAYRGDRTDVKPTAATGPTTAAPADAPAQSGKAAGAGSDYTIVKGDNLTKISKKFGVSIQDIMKANPYIKDPNLIYAGKTLKIPGGAADQGGTTSGSVGGGKTNLTKWYASEMAELETLIGKYANDPEMADDVKAAQTQLDALKATGK